MLVTKIEMTKSPEQERASGGDTPAQTDAPLESPASPFQSRRDSLGTLLLVALVFLVYQPVWQAGFIWDDDVHVTANPSIIGPLGLKEIWTTSASDIFPATLTTFWLEHELWGLTPTPYHLVTVLLHAAGAVAFWRVLLALRVPGAWLGAALWALHPVEVESAAWITETKNTQSGLFYLLAILFFVKGLALQKPRAGTAGEPNYALSLLFAALAMASKPSTVILPLVLCLCVWWVEKGWNWRTAARTVPFFFLSLVSSIYSILIVRLQAAMATDPDIARPWPERLVTAGEAVWFYLGKLIWPRPLVAIYPFAEPEAGRWISWLPLLGVGGVLLVLWCKRDSWGRPWFFAFAYFLAALLPVLGLVSHAIIRYSPVFDHFQYLASMGPLALAGAGMSWLGDRLLPQKPELRAGLAAGLLAILGVVSWQRAAVFKNEQTLWADTLAKNPDCWLGYFNLGVAQVHEGRLDDAMANFRQALAIKPRYAEAHDNLGNALSLKGDLAAAVAEYQAALQINPNYARAHNNLGVVLGRQQHHAEAVAEWKKALEIDPQYAEAHNNLGKALQQEGKIGDALAEYQKAADAAPGLLEAHNNLAQALLLQGRLDDAIEQGEEALDIDPNSVDAHVNLSTALLRQGRLDAAFDQCRMALQINSGSLEAHNNLGFILLQRGQFDAAIEQGQQALAIDPANAEARYNLGSALQQKGRLDEAIAQYQLALTSNPKITQVHINLGNALFQKGQLDAAVAQYRQALDLDPASVEGHSNLAIVLARQGQLDGAISEFGKALALNPSMVQVHDNLGTALLQKGRTDEARAQFQAALQLNPDDAYAQKYLATMTAEQGHGQK